MRHKVFVSYHHKNDQAYKDALIAYGGDDLFIDRSVSTGDIDPGLPDEAIRRRVRENWLSDSTVTIVLVGRETWGRKHVDWEIYSTMYDGEAYKKGGILTVLLPTCGLDVANAPSPAEQQLVYPQTTHWHSEQSVLSTPPMPKRIRDSIVRGAPISVVPWRYLDERTLPFLIHEAYMRRPGCHYDLSPMRKNNARVPLAAFR